MPVLMAAAAIENTPSSIIWKRGSAVVPAITSSFVVTDSTGCVRINFSKNRAYSPRHGCRMRRRPHREGHVAEKKRTLNLEQS